MKCEGRHLGGNKASNEHLTKSYTKTPAHPISLPIRMHTHAIPCPCHGGEWKGTSVKRSAPLHLREKGLHHRVVSGNVTSSPAITAQVICSRAQKVPYNCSQSSSLVRLLLFHRLSSSLPACIGTVFSAALWLNQESACANAGW